MPRWNVTRWEGNMLKMETGEVRLVTDTASWALLVQGYLT